jgi:hypothetical protein
MQSSEGSFVYVNNAKKTRCSWRGSVTPKKNKTYKVQFTLNLNENRTVLDVEATLNPDQTINLHGQTTQIKGNKTTRTPIHLNHFNLKNLKNVPQLMTANM